MTAAALPIRHRTHWLRWAQLVAHRDALPTMSLRASGGSRDGKPGHPQYRQDDAEHYLGRDVEGQVAAATDVLKLLRGAGGPRPSAQQLVAGGIVLSRFRAGLPGSQRPLRHFISLRGVS